MKYRLAYIAAKPLAARSKSMLAYRARRYSSEVRYAPRRRR